MCETKASDHLTKITAVAPNMQGCGLWQEALQTFFCHDQELINYVQEIVGLCAIGEVYLEALIIAYGDGRNGKSNFWNTIAAVLGTHTGHFSADALTVGVKRNVKPEMAEARGKRLIISAELEEGKRLNTSTIKQLCSTNEIYAEKKYKAPFSFKPSHTLVLYTNYLPHIGGNDEGTWRRLIVIPFKAKLSKTHDIKNYSEYLVKNAGGAVLSWIIEGAQYIIADKFQPTMPQVVSETSQKYHEENNWLQHFLEDCCEINVPSTTKSGELYHRYRNYCADNGEYTRSTTDFYSALARAGFTHQRKKDGSYVKGLGLVANEFIN